MLSTNNIFSPANGQPIITPSQDMVLGMYYLTKDHIAAYEKEEPRFFSALSELFLAYGHGLTQTHRPLRLRMDIGATSVAVSVNDTLLDTADVSISLAGFRIALRATEAIGYVAFDEYVVSAPGR